jgi:hypothetical protein
MRTRTQARWRGLRYARSVSETQVLAAAIDEMARVRGDDAWLGRPPLLPNERDFPDRWKGDLRSVERLIERLMEHAGLEELALSVELASPEELGTATHTIGHDGRINERTHEGTAAWFAGIRRGTCLFGVRSDLIDNAQAIVAVLAHEVCHAYRAHHDLVVRNRDAEERLTDATTVFLGFGVLTTNAAERHYSSAMSGSSMSGHRWGHSKHGYLDAATFAALLAQQSWRREASSSEVREIAAALEPNQRDVYERTLVALRDGVDEGTAYAKFAVRSDRNAWLSIALFVSLPIVLLAILFLWRLLAT